MIVYYLYSRCFRTGEDIDLVFSEAPVRILREPPRVTRYLCIDLCKGLVGGEKTFAIPVFWPPLAGASQVQGSRRWCGADCTKRMLPVGQDVVSRVLIVYPGEGGCCTLCPAARGGYAAVLLLCLLHVLQHDDGPHGLVLLFLFEFNLSALPVSLSQTQAAAQPPA